MLAVFLVALSLTAFDRAFSQAVAGQVVRASGQPVPGCTVSLVNFSARSSPSVTDAFGRYYFNFVPIGTYYIEVYWGPTLLYRNTLMVQGNIQLSPIVLP
jgi:Carboxypeptidase regulatory-like domain